MSIFVLAMVASGCATFLNDASQTVTFDSSPNGARIFMNGVEVGITPLSMQVRRSRNTMILAKKDGYEDQQLALQTTTTGKFWANGPIGSTVDYLSDAMIEYSPNQYYIRLNRMTPLQSYDGGVVADGETRARIEQKSMRTEERVRAYIIRSDQYLRTDLARGHGEYLSGLSSLLRLPANSETLKRLRSIAVRNREAPSFAEAVLTQYPANDPDDTAQGLKTNRTRR
jgi:hypothetical protein